MEAIPGQGKPVVRSPLLSDEQIASLLHRKRNGEPLKDLCQEFGVSMSWISRTLKKMGVRNLQRKLPEGKRNEIVRAYASGEPSTAIAARIGCSASTVLNVAREQGIETRTTRSYGNYDPNPAIREVFSKYQYAARIRNLPFDLSREEFEGRILSPCYYCGALPGNRAVKGKHELLYNGIDRIDPALGYFTRNVVSCCETCNKAKLALSLEEFQDWFRRANKHGIVQNISVLLARPSGLIDKENA